MGTSVTMVCTLREQECLPVSESEGSHSQCLFDLVTKILSTQHRLSLTSGALVRHFVCQEANHFLMRPVNL